MGVREAIMMGARDCGINLWWDDWSFGTMMPW